MWLDKILIALMFMVIVGSGAYISQAPEEKEIKQPTESDRRVILTCTVKSNIAGVITLNDECDITVIGEE